MSKNITFAHFHLILMHFLFLTYLFSISHIFHEIAKISIFYKYFYFPSLQKFHKNSHALLSSFLTFSSIYFSYFQKIKNFIPILGPTLTRIWVHNYKTCITNSGCYTIPLVMSLLDWILSIYSHLRAYIHYGLL